MTVMMGAAIGLGLSVGGAVLIEFLDDTIKASEEATRLTQLPVLGAIPRIGGDGYDSKLVVHQQPLSTTAEACRVLRTNVRFSFIDHPMRTLMVTSSGPSEGKSVILSNLAVAVAQSGLQVILVDTDFRRPSLHKIFDIPNVHGLSNVFLDAEANVSDYLQDTMVENLRLLSCGPLPPNPAEVLSSERMKVVVEILLTKADIVLFDSPPVLVVTDAAVLSTYMLEGGVLIVVEIGKTHRGMIKRAVEELQRVRPNLIGVIVNRINERTGSEYHQYYRDYVSDNNKMKKQFQFRIK
jgi:capsular exopolysaccharide synthesis family protein